MKIYFAGAIRGGREFQSFYSQIIEYLKNYGTVLTEHIGNPDIDVSGESDMDDIEIYSRDREWIIESNLIIAEVSNPSLGVGYELGLAESLGKKVLCLFYEGNPNQLSAMIAGNNSYQIETYKNFDNAKSIIDSFIKEI